MNLVFTLIDPQDFSKACILGESLKNNFKIVVIGEKCPIDDANVLFIKDLVDLSLFPSDYTTEELIAAVKPFVFKYFFENGFEKILYLQPHCCVSGNLAEVFDSMKGLFLVAQEREPEAFKDEKQILNQGMFSRHVVGMANYDLTKDFITWWSSKTIDKAYKRPMDGLFLDGIWLNHAPIFFEKVTIDRTLKLMDGVWRSVENPIISHFIKSKKPKFGLDALPFGKMAIKEPSDFQKTLARPFQKTADFIDKTILNFAKTIYK